MEGFDGATNKEIARLAGLAPNAMYHYFGSKADLYLEVCDRVASRLLGMLERSVSSGSTLEERLRSLFVEVAHAGTDSPSMIGFVAGIGTVVRRHPELLPSVEQRLLSRVRSELATLVDTSSDRAGVLGEVETTGFVDLVIVVIMGLGRLGLNRPSERYRAAGGAFLALVSATRGE